MDGEKMKRPGKNGLLYAFVSLLLAAAAGTLLMILAYCLPTAGIREHVRESLPVFQTEGDYFFWAPGFSAAKIDNFTDSLMLNQASRPVTNAVQDAMLNPYVQYHGKTQFYQSLESDLGNDPDPDRSEMTYARYWHGELVWLKLLLEFMTLQEIRLLNMMVQFFLLALVLHKIRTALGGPYAAAFLLTVLFINPVTTAMNLQMSSVYVPTLCSCLAILTSREKDHGGSWRIFLWTGTAVAYFDLLTYPLVSLGLPLVLAFCLGPEEESPAAMAVRTVRDSASWLLGYAGMWAEKWGIAALLTDEDVFGQARASILVRTKGEGSGSAYSFRSALANNVRAAHPKILLLVSAVILAAVLAACFLGIFRVRLSWRSAAVLTVCSFPFIWYAVLRSHSAVHYFMAYRNLAVPVFAALVSGCMMLEEGPRKRGGVMR